MKTIQLFFDMELNSRSEIIPLRDWTLPAMFVPMLLSNMKYYPLCAVLATGSPDKLFDCVLFLHFYSECMGFTECFVEL